MEEAKTIIGGMVAGQTLPDTIRMRKEGQPDSDVHPLEVENWKSHGWEILANPDSEDKVSQKTAKPTKAK